MKLLLASIAALLVLAISPANAQSVTGVWQTESTSEGYLEIRITNCGSKICGTIINARNNEGQAVSYPHLGKRMIWDMTPSGSARWADGKIWDPRRDATFNSKMELKGRELQVSGCFLGFCQAQAWQRVN